VTNVPEQARNQGWGATGQFPPVRYSSKLSSLPHEKTVVQQQVKIIFPHKISADCLPVPE